MPLSQLLHTSREELQSELRLILDAVAEGVTGIDRLGNCTFCNDAFLRMTGFAASELIGLNMHALVHHSRRDGSPYPAEECVFLEAVKAGRSIHTIEPVWRKDGTCFSAECWCHPLPGNSERTAYLITVLDITEREAAAEALRKSEERFQQISSNIDQVFYLASSDSGRLAYVSPSFDKMFGRGWQMSHQAPGLWLEAIIPEHREQILDSHKQLVAGNPIQDEYKIVRPDGTTRWIKHHANPIRDGQGKVRQYAGVLEDITETHNTREALHAYVSALEQSEEKYRSLVRNIPDVVWSVDDARRVTFISPNVEQFFGHSAEELYRLGARVWFESIHPDDATKVSQAFEALFTKGEPYDVECRVRRKDGTWIWAHDRAFVTYEKDGKRYADGVLSDITARKRAEEELRSKSAFLEAISNSTIDGIMVVDDQNERILQNQQLMKMLKVPQHILEEKSVLAMRHHVAARTKDPEELLARIANLYEHPQETSWDEIEFKDGTILDTYSAPAIGQDGKHYGRIWTFRDITERRRDEDVLRQLSLAVEQSPVSIMITDPQARITYVNPRFSQWTGYTRGEVMGRNPRFLKSGQTSPAEYSRMWQTLTGGNSWRGEFCNRRKNGELYWESVAITPIKDAKGAITRFLGIKEDITERRAMESQLRQAQKLEAIGQLAAGIAHEINTPTQFASDNLSFLRDSWGSLHRVLSVYRTVIGDGIQNGFSPQSWARIHQAERDEDLDFIAAEMPRAIEQALDGMQRVAQIVRAMKEFSHSDSGDKQPVDINKAIETTITVARNEWKYVAEVETRFDPGLPLVSCHAGELNQVVLNLIVNAAHAIRDKVTDGQKGLITVRTCAKGGFAEIAITDTGDGIPEAIRSRVFDPFFTTKEVGKGTGQGLSLAHSSVVKKHGGKIWFETEVGRGTTFFVHLPMHGSGGEKEP
jgi:PAS domain S-box-containing protein